jgi:hypothetical protein
VNGIHPERERGQAPIAPVITVSRGRATEAEIAAVTTVLLAVRSAAVAAAAATAAATAAERPPSSRWAESSRVRPWPSRPGPRAWRASALPR